MSLRHLAGSVLLAAGLAATMCVGTYWTASAMQSGLVEQAQATLAARHLKATVAVSGRDAYVWADTPTARAAAIAALQTIPGIRIAVPGEGSAPTTVVSSPPAAASPLRPPPSATRTSLPAAGATTPSATSGGPTSATPPVQSATASVASASLPAWPAIHFDGDSRTLDASGKAQAVKIATFMVANPAVTVVLTGYTDTSHTESDRQATGLARAKAVQAVLSANGVPASRTSVMSRGGADPVASNDTAQGRALNRRVTVTMTREG